LAVYEIYSKAFSSLTFDAKCLDPAFGVAYGAIGRNGAFTLTEPVFDEAFEALFETQVNAGELFSEPAAEPQPTPIPTAPQGFFELPLSPLKRSRYRSLQRRLADYPPYEPPIRTNVAYLSAAEGRRNFDFLMKSKAERLDHLKAFLAKEGIVLELSGEGADRSS